VLDSEIYEPAAAVPLPNSSSRIRERAVEFRSARDTWLRSIIKDDCTLGMKRRREDNSQSVTTMCQQLSTQKQRFRFRDLLWRPTRGFERV
jgi:hypothetical protein